MKLLRKLVAWLCVAIAICCIIVCLCCVFTGAPIALSAATFGLLNFSASFGWLGWLLWGLLFLAIGYMMDPEVAGKLVNRVSTAISEAASDVGKGAVSILDSVTSALGGSSTLWLIALCVGGYFLIKNASSDSGSSTLVIRDGERATSQSSPMPAAREEA